MIFDIERAGSTTARTVQVPSGTLLRVALRQVGQAAEGCAVLDAGVSVPLDTPLRISGHLTVIPTFSGG